ncbi:MAG TPA: triple tyrosine motif-containing protein [Puia sp.]|nr:triple tyrosine motif-containing protein [Puia sp.]
MRASLTAIFLLTLICSCYSQNTIGVPDIINYSKDIYNAGTQNRAIVQDKSGVIWFANYEGLLSFDGATWKTFPLPNKTVVRSVAIGMDNKIYAGGQDDFGYFSPQKNGSLAYTSLKGLLQEQNHSFSDIWNIVPYGKEIFFRSRERIFRLSDNRITVYPAVKEWQFLGESNGHLIAEDGKNGLLEFSNGLWAPFLKMSALPPGGLVTGMFPFGKDSSFIATVNTGFYILCHDTITPFRFAGADPFSSQRVLTAIPVSKEWLAIGTNLNGIYIVNKKGQVIQNLSRKEGLQNNNILKLFLDKSRNLWLGLDNGIDLIAYNNALKHIYPEKLNEGLGYTSIVYNKQLYVGTSNGLYVVPVTGKEDLSFLNGEFRSVPGTKGSTWGLVEVNGSLLLGHHDGAFQIQGEKLIPVDTRTAYWTFSALAQSFASSPASSATPSSASSPPLPPSSLVVAGNDQGIDLFHYENGRFIPGGNIPGFSASSQFMAIDKDKTIWVAHPYRGVYRIGMNKPGNPETRLYTEKNGLPSDLKNHLFKIKDHIVVATEKGVYEYNTRFDSFTPSPWFTPFFGERNIRYLREDPSGNIWFIEDNSVGVIDFSGPQPETIYFPELNGKMVADFEHIYPYDKFNVFVGAEKGFYHINYEEYKKNRYPIQVKIRSVRISGKTDSLLFGGYFGEVGENMEQPARSIYRISNKWNSLHFEYSSSSYAAQASVKYSYYLKGFDKDWSGWSRNTEKEYTNLPAGNYTFQVRSKSNLGNESAASSYSFTVLPPWYQTGWAWLLYLLLFAGLACLLILWQRRLFRRQQQRHEDEQKRLQYLHQLELEKSEKEIVKLKNEKLEAEIGYKNTELASTSMHLVQKGELLGNVREELVRLKNGANGDGSADAFRKIIRILGEENKMDKDWEQFAIHFDAVHSNFLKILKTAHPRLSPHELKLCAWLRMNLSSKEIAQLENISVRGVELGRYRLRKKLRIPTETNLFDFLMELHSSNKTPQ